MKRIRGFLLFVALIVLTGAGAFMTIREARPFLMPPPTSLEEYHAILSGSVRPGLSAYSKRVLLNGCLYGMTSIQANARPAEQNRQFAQRCGALGQQILETMPTNAAGWLVAATAAAVLDDSDGLNLGLARSQRMAGNELWLALLRFPLAEDHLARLNDTARRAAEADLALLASTWQGTRALAARYSADLTFRERITAVMATQPADIQRRFLDVTRKALKKGAETAP